MIHVSQLKKALSPGETAQEELPQLVEVKMPARVLQQRLHTAGATSGTQVLVQWSGSSPSSATWEDLSELQSWFPHALAWGQASPEEGGMLQIQREGITVNRRTEIVSKGEDSAGAGAGRQITIRRLNWGLEDSRRAALLVGGP